MGYITYKAIIDRRQRHSDGTYNVKVRVTFARKSRVLATSVSVAESSVTRGGKLKDQQAVLKVDRLIARMREATADLAVFAPSTLDVDRVVSLIRARLGGESWRLDFFDFGRRVAAEKSPATRAAYITALNNLARYLGRNTLDINDITKTMVADFRAWLDSAPKMQRRRDGSFCPTGRAKLPGVASAIAVQKLAHIYGRAKDTYNDEDAGIVRIPRSPFAGVKATPPPSRTGQTALSLEQVQTIIDDCRQMDDCRVRTALAALLLSLGTMGANLADLWEAAPPVGGVWIYRRKKVTARRADGAEMRVTVLPQSQWLAGILGVGTSDKLWLPGLRSLNPKAAQITTAVNREIATYCKSKGWTRFTFYAARKSWATFARNLAGVDKATVDEALCHVGDYRMADIYIARSWAGVNAANAAVLALFRW